MVRTTWVNLWKKRQWLCHLWRSLVRSRNLLCPWISVISLFRLLTPLILCLPGCSVISNLFLETPRCVGLFCQLVTGSRVISKGNLNWENDSIRSTHRAFFPLFVSNNIFINIISQSQSQLLLVPAPWLTYPLTTPLSLLDGVHPWTGPNHSGTSSHWRSRYMFFHWGQTGQPS